MSGISNLILSGMARVTSGGGYTQYRKFGSDQGFVRKHIANVDEYENAPTGAKPDLVAKWPRVMVSMKTTQVFTDWRTKSGINRKGEKYTLGVKPDVKCEVLLTDENGFSILGQTIIGTAIVGKDGKPFECDVTVGVSDNGKYWVAFKAVNQVEDLDELAAFAKPFEVAASEATQTATKSGKMGIK